MSTKSNIPQTASNQPTRRQFLQALAILPVAALPAWPTVTTVTPEPPTTPPPNRTNPIPQTAEALTKRLSDLSIIMAVVPIWLHSRLDSTQQEDPVKILKQYDEAYEAAEEYQRLILTHEFDQLILAPLCGGPERYAEILHNWQEPEGIAPGPVDEVKQSTLDLAIVAIEQAAKR